MFIQNRKRGSSVERPRFPKERRNAQDTYFTVCFEFYTLVVFYQLELLVFQVRETEIVWEFGLVDKK